MKKLHLLRDDRGAAIVEIAFALPAFIVLLWSMVQMGLVYRANSGIQHALGQGARFATLYPTPSDADITAKMNEAVYGIGPGRFETVVTDTTSGYKDLRVTYTQPTNLLLFPGPTITVNKSKRVWVASTATAAAGGTDESGTGTETGTGTGTGTDSGTGTTTGGGTTTDGGSTGTGTTTGGTGTTTDGGTTTGGTTTGGTTTGGTTTGGTTTGGTTTGGTTTGGTTTGGTTTTGNNGNGNGNGNTVCTKKNGKAC